MANNRMFLVHRPTGKAVMLGKKTPGGWHGVPPFAHVFIQSLFDATEGDDYALVMEDSDSSPATSDDWDYASRDADQDGLLTLDLNPQRGNHEA